MEYNELLPVKVQISRLIFAIACILYGFSFKNKLYVVFVQSISPV